MTLISAIKKDDGKSAEIKFVIEADKFNAEVEKIFRKKSAGLTVPGFRKGKAPRAVIDKMYGKGYFYEDAINELLGSEYPEAVKAASEFEFVGRPEIDVESIDEKGVTIIAVAAIKPDVEIGEYKGIKATRKVEATTEEDVNAEIDKVRERNSRTVDVTDRPAQNGDTVTIDYSGSVDGVKFDGGTAENQTLELGSGSFIPGFEEQVVGHSIGDSFDINVKFPEEYHAEELKGKDAVFAIVLHEIKKVELPVADDDFAKDVSEFDTLAEYKKDIEAKLIAEKENTADRLVDDQLMESLLSIVTVDIPSEMIETETENFVRDYDSRLRMNGLDLKQYFKYTGMTLDDLRAKMRPDAEKQVKSRLALEKIASLENISVSDEEIGEEFEKLAKSYNLEVAKCKEFVQDEDIKKDIAVRKAIDLVRANAVITEEKPKKAAKKTTKKKAETVNE